MAKYKEYSYEEARFILIHFDRQILPGTFEYPPSYLIDHEVNLSNFDKRYKNDETGAPAYDQAILLKIILYGYARGIVSSRKIEQCCRENIIFMALSADTRRHFTTIAHFVSSLGDEMQLIGKDMFSIDGWKLPANASKDMQLYDSYRYIV